MTSDKSSLLYWYPMVKDLPIPQPKTEIMKTDIDKMLWIDFIDGKTVPFNFAELQTICRGIGYPLFIRTDLASGKHEWKNTCFIEKEDSLLQNLRNIIEFSFVADIVGLDINAIIVREYIQMKTLFTAFWGEMPVNPEIRFFVKHKEVLCWHWYWVEDSIKNPSVENWRELLSNEAYISGNETLLLTKDAEKVAGVFDGYWSVDFCKAEDGRWILIDLAEGKVSWHPKDCPIKINEDKHG